MMEDEPPDHRVRRRQPTQVLAMTLLIGIDPGVNTGYAEWDTVSRKLLAVETLSLHQALFRIHDSPHTCRVRFEDARLRTWFGTAGREVLQGVGAVKAHCKIWQDFCDDFGIQWEGVKPQKGLTKWSAEQFVRVTGWKGRTSEHSRDAACLVFGT